MGLECGLQPDLALIYRDKILMKEKAHTNGFPVPKFRRISSPIDIIEFVRHHGFPVIIKPSMGQASSGIIILNDQIQLNQYLENDFFTFINDKLMEYTGNLIIEEFIQSKIIHVNGFSKNGIIKYFWPFYYHSTNLNFTLGKSYGNIYISKNDPMHVQIFGITQQLLDSLGTCENMVFHGELFEVFDQNTGTYTYKLCEIAARRPGGSIGILIDQVENNFPGLEFRLNIGLEPRKDTKPNIENFSCADLIIPLKRGKLISIPSESECAIRNCIYKPFGKVGTIYKGFDVNVLNTAARFMFFNDPYEIPTISSMETKLSMAQTWFSKHVSYEPLTQDMDLGKINLKNAKSLEKIVSDLAVIHSS